LLLQFPIRSVYTWQYSCWDTMAIRAKMGEKKIHVQLQKLKFTETGGKHHVGINNLSLLTYQQCVLINSQKSRASTRKGCNNCLREFPHQWTISQSSKIRPSSSLFLLSKPKPALD
jgi:hypothetical protein